MKFRYKIYWAICLFSFAIIGCEKVLDVDSERFQKPDEYKLDAPNENIYAMSGIFSQLQKIAERYVLLGELRGELMDVTDDASLYLKQINNFEITTDNPYANIKDYYAVINNCNLVINSIDTSVFADGEKIMYRVYAAAKAIRAWTYMQIALNYGRAVYYEKPILTIEDAEKVYPKYNISELTTVLIPDLLPWKDTPFPSLGVIGELNSSYFNFSIRFLLGELYLWSGQYELAASEYRDLLFSRRIASNTRRATWEVVNGEFTSTTGYYTDDVITAIGTTTEYGEGSHLTDMSWPFSRNSNGYGNLTLVGKNVIKPSVQSISNWDNQIYYSKDPSVRITGDLRGRFWSYYTRASFNYGKSVPGYDTYIGKYYDNNYRYDYSEIVPTCTGILLYLRYAEAINRLGKPNLAFAVLKDGLNKINLGNTNIVPASEIPNPKPNYMNFDTIWFDTNIGVHARGCGYTQNATDYVIPPQQSKEDSIKYVEDQIKLELALETAFEGNRFHDLMRISLRRNDPAYLANTVAEKYTDNKEAIRSKLMDMTNWYLPQK